MPEPERGMRPQAEAPAPPGPVLVTGASGLVGRRLVAALLREGLAVRALSRDPGAAGLPEGVEAVAWNGRNVSSEALFRTRGVVHLAGEPVFAGRLTPQRQRRIRDSRVESARSIVAALRDLPEDDRPPVFLCASAVGYYGSRGDALLRESTAPGEGFLARVCVEWEQAAAEAATLGVRSVQLRIGIVLAREGGALPRLKLPFQLGLGGRLGDGRQWFPWIHVDDLVGLILAALRDDGYQGPVNATAPAPVTNAELTRTLGRVLSRPTLLPVPALALRVALGELSEELLGSRRVVPQVALDRGFAFAHPTLEEALRAELG